jgi:predicted transcriptional regulator
MVTPQEPAMPTFSVKLPEETKRRLDELAAREGVTPHAFMVEAIESRLGAREKYDAFVQEALDAHAEMLATGKAYDGDEVLAYMRSRVRGEQPARPRARSFEQLLKKRR